MKQCIEPGCNNNQFGGGYCKYHAYRRYMQGGDLHKRKTTVKKAIPKESKRRKKEHIYYAEGCKLLEQEMRDANEGKIYDFFTDKEIKGFVTWHHLLGRTGNYYLDKDLLVPAENDENDGHLFFHRATYEQLKKREWWEGFLARLKSKSEEAYKKITRMEEKSHKLHPTIFDDDDY